MAMPQEEMPLPKRLLEPPTMSPLKHRIYAGSPAKIRSPKRIFEVATREDTNVWKARRVSREVDLQLGEVYITHRRIVDEVECCNALAKLGVSQAVLVLEGLGFLGEHVDVHFNSLSKMAMYQNDVETIMKSMRSSQGKGSFSRFAHALYKGCKEEGEVYDAVVRSGMSIFWDVLEVAAEDNPANEALNAMKGAEGREAQFQTLKAWSKVFLLLEERHQRSHPFNFIKGDTELAEAALEAFKFIATESKEEKYKELSQVMQAAIPIVTERIVEKKMQLMELKAREGMEDEVVCNRLPIRMKFKEHGRKYGDRLNGHGQRGTPPE